MPDNRTTRGTRRPYSALIETSKTAAGRSHRIRWVDPATGERRSENCGPDLAYARDRRDAKMMELRAGLRGDIGEHQLTELIAAIPGWMAGQATATRDVTLRALKRLRRHIGDCRLRRIDRSALMDYRAAMIEAGLAPATINKELRSIASALTYAVDAGWIVVSPMWRWRKMQLPEPEQKVRVVEPDEYEQLQAVCEDPRVRVALALAFYHGMRRLEICQLRWTEVNLDRGLLQVVNTPSAGELTKSRKIRTAPIRATLLEKLRAWWDETPKRITNGAIEPASPHMLTWPNGRPLKPTWLSRTFAGLVKTAEIRYCTFHDLRRSWSTLAQRGGLDASTVQELGGWSSVDVVRRHYTGDVSEAHRRAVDRLDGGVAG